MRKRCTRCLVGQANRGGSIEAPAQGGAGSLILVARRKGTTGGLGDIDKLQARSRTKLADFLMPFRPVFVETTLPRCDSSLSFADAVAPFRPPNANRACENGARRRLAARPPQA